MTQKKSDKFEFETNTKGEVETSPRNHPVEWFQCSSYGLVENNTCKLPSEKENTLRQMTQKKTKWKLRQQY
jgi:hypothetical protein